MRTRLRLGLLVSLVGVAMAFPAVSFGGPVRIVATGDDTWNPNYQHIAPGTRVVWVNPDRSNDVHDVTAYGRNWDKRVLLQPGERTGKRFTSTGTDKYRCRLHSQMQDGQCRGMCGVIHVMR